MIEIDLEKRWCHFGQLPETQSVDKHGFPLRPLLEDYIAILPGRSEHLLTPQLLAHEYRVRVSSGHSPRKDEYAARLPDQQAATKVPAAPSRWLPCIP